MYKYIQQRPNLFNEFHAGRYRKCYAELVAGITSELIPGETVTARNQKNTYWRRLEK
jgi:hypothetical protein